MGTKSIIKKAAELGCGPAGFIIKKPLYRRNLARILSLYKTFPKSLKKKVHIEGGRFCFTLKGLGLTGVEWLEKIDRGEICATLVMRDMLSNPVYDWLHRLKSGKKYKIILVNSNEIVEPNKRTVRNLGLVAHYYLINKLFNKQRAELAFLIFKKFTMEELSMLGISFVTVSHVPIKDSFENKYRFSYVSAFIVSMVGGISSIPDGLLAKGEVFPYVVC